MRQLRTGSVIRMGEKIWVSLLMTSWVNAVVYGSLSKKERKVYMTRGCVSKGSRTLTWQSHLLWTQLPPGLIKDRWSTVVMTDPGLDFLAYIPALPLTSCIDLGKLFDLSGLSFLHLKDGMLIGHTSIGL